MPIFAMRKNSVNYPYDFNTLSMWTLLGSYQVRDLKMYISQS